MMYPKLFENSVAQGGTLVALFCVKVPIQGNQPQKRLEYGYWAPGTKEILNPETLKP